MNITIVDRDTLAQTIEESTILATLAGPGANQTLVATRYGTDIIIIADSKTGQAAVIEPCSKDYEADGSVHDHARTIFN